MSYATGIGQATVHQTKRSNNSMIKLTIRYARYILSALATVGFGINLN
jgi:hypothetical protein